MGAVPKSLQSESSSPPIDLLCSTYSSKQNFNSQLDGLSRNIQRYRIGKIEQVYLYISPVQKSHFPFHHHELIIKFSQFKYLCIGLNSTGLEKLVSQNLFCIVGRRRRRRQNRLSERVPFRYNLIIADILQIIELIEDKQYNPVLWNCQHFCSHISQKLDDCLLLFNLYQQHSIVFAILLIESEI